MSLASDIVHHGLGVFCRAPNNAALGFWKSRMT
jgi:hypothetical protein